MLGLLLQLNKGLGLTQIDMMDHPVLSEEEIKERIEHRDALLDIRAILATSSGKRFFKYLFKSFEVGQLPPLGMTGDLLMDKIGSLRAGEAFFQIVAEADSEAAGFLLAQIKKEEYEQLYAEVQNGRS